MPKFYVQSGTFRRVVAADSGRKAALWAVHEVMQQIMPTDSENEPHAPDSHRTASQSIDQAAGNESVMVLSGTVRVDDRGFDRLDASELSTMEVVAEWNQMVMTLDRLQRMLDTPTRKSATRGDSTSHTAAPENRFSQQDFGDDRFSDDRFSDDRFHDDLAA